MENVTMPPASADAVPSTPAILAVLRDPEADQVFSFFRRSWNVKIGPKRPKHEIAFAANRICKTDALVHQAISHGHARADSSILPEANLHRVLIRSECATREERSRLAKFHRRLGSLLRKKSFRIIAPRVEAMYRRENGSEPPPKFGKMCMVLAAYICSLRIHPDVGAPSAFRQVLTLFGRGNVLFRWEKTSAFNLVLAE